MDLHAQGGYIRLVSRLGTVTANILLGVRVRFTQHLFNVSN